MNKAYATYGIGLEAADGAAAAPQATFLASADSNGIDASTSTEAVSLTNGKRDTTAGRYIGSVESTATGTTLAFPDFLALLLYAALGSVESTGESAPFTHDITMGESLPPVTFTQQVGASDAPLQTLQGCKLDTLNLSAEGVAPLSVEFGFAGCAAKWLAATAWNGPAFDGANGWFTSEGAEVMFSLTDDSPSQPPSSVSLSSVAFSIENNVEASTRFGSVEPDRQDEGASTVTATLEGTTSSTALYRAVKTGSESGTEIAKSIVVGSLQVTFPHTKDKDLSLVVKMGAIPWTVEAMAASPEGGPFSLSLSTDGAISAGGTSIEFIVANGTEKYEVSA